MPTNPIDPAQNQADRAAAERQATTDRATADRAAARAANPSANTVDDPTQQLGQPVSDRIATGRGLPIPPAVIGGPMPAPPEPVVGGVQVPDAETISGADQNRIEVLTGARLQRNDTPPVKEAMNEGDKRDSQRDIAATNERLAGRPAGSTAAARQGAQVAHPTKPADQKPADKN